MRPKKTSQLFAIPIGQSGTRLIQTSIVGRDGKLEQQITQRRHIQYYTLANLNFPKIVNISQRLLNTIIRSMTSPDILI